jgi:hypothetical protein
MSEEQLSPDVTVTESRRKFRWRIGCIPLILLSALLLCGFLYLWVTSSRIFPATDELHLSQPICGTWQATSGSILGPSVPKVNDVTVVSTNEVWAVGTGATAHGWDVTRSNTIHRWDGIRWNTMHFDSARSDTIIYSISALPSGEVWAVGEWSAYSIAAFRWNGNHWSLTPGPSSLQGKSVLYDVAGTSSDDVWAVGAYSDGAKDNSLVLHWNGSDWHVVETPNNCSGDQQLSGLYAISPNDVWAVGRCSDGTIGSLTQTDRTLVQRWDGKKWTVVPSPNYSAGQIIKSSSLDTISGTANNNLWAIGNYWDTNGTGGYWTQPLVEHWNGYEWRVVSFPYPGISTMSNTSDLVVIDSNEVWVTGFIAAGTLRPLLVRWDGSQWQEVSAPKPLAESYYTSIVATDRKELLAMGFGFDNEDGAYYGISARFQYGQCSGKSFEWLNLGLSQC